MTKKIAFNLMSKNPLQNIRSKKINGGCRFKIESDQKRNRLHFKMRNPFKMNRTKKKVNQKIEIALNFI